MLILASIDWATILGNCASGGVLGLIGSLATGFLTLAQKKQEHAFRIEEMKEERETMRLQVELKQVETAGNIAVEREKGAAEAFTASVSAEGRIKGEWKWVTSLRAFTRPGLTWYFTGLATLIVTYVKLTENSTELQQYAALMVVNMDAMMISWWFGQRQIDKMSIEWGNKAAGAKVSGK